MKSVLFYISHPAHYLLFRNSIKLMRNKYKVFVVIKSKDVLQELLEEAGQDFINILPEGRGNSRSGMLMGMIKRDWRLLKFCMMHKPDILCGTGPEIGHVGSVLGITSYNFREDDVHIYSWPFVLLNYPWHTKIVSPDVCDNGRWKYKTIAYPGYHELAYLHPDNFTPNKDIIEQYSLNDGAYVLIRFAKLTAHHDRGVGGISDKLALDVIDKIKNKFQVVISSERELPNELECYRLKINPLHIHDIMYFAKGYIGDSQTMAAEAGVLGTPFIRFNDFVGRLGYLNDLENNFGLGKGIRTKYPEQLLSSVEELVDNQTTKDVTLEKRNYMLAQKLNTSVFISELIESVLNERV